MTPLSAQSIRDRLLERARERGDDFGLVLTQYGIERILYRLSISPYAEQFVLKGAQLLRAKTEEIYRPTRDVDLLGFGENSPEALWTVFTSLVELDVQDGLVFDLARMTTEVITEAAEYQGIRVSLQATLARARLHIQIDVGFGDQLTPAPSPIEFPTLLEMPAPALRGYALETVVAEKLQAITSLGLLNTRLKDYYDLWRISATLPVRYNELVGALVATFTARHTAIDTEPVGLSGTYGEQRERQQQWTNFLKRNMLTSADLNSVCSTILDCYRKALVQAASEQDHQ